MCVGLHVNPISHSISVDIGARGMEQCERCDNRISSSSISEHNMLQRDLDDDNDDQSQSVHYSLVQHIHTHCRIEMKCVVWLVNDHCVHTKYYQNTIHFPVALDCVFFRALNIWFLQQSMFDVILCTHTHTHTKVRHIHFCAANNQHTERARAHSLSLSVD